MSRLLRLILVFSGSVAVVIAIGFFLQMTWATQVWPLKSGRLSNIFISSILAAIGAPIVWIGLVGERRAMAGGALNLLVTHAGFAWTTLTLYILKRQPEMLYFGIFSIVMVILTAGLFVYSQPKKFLDMSPTPVLVRISFYVFSAVLLGTAISLIVQRPNTFPWALSPENSVMYGWFFLGAMCYFIYGIVFPVMNNARGQLLGFLAYDLVLIVPFIGYFRTVTPDNLLSLIVYVSVICYSGLLALYYLVVYRRTRLAMAQKSEMAGD
jgi:hypothetical protein